MSYAAPSRCESCGQIINNKPKGRRSKYCPPCRETKQEVYKQQLRADRKSRNRVIDPTAQQ